MRLASIDKNISARVNDLVDRKGYEALTQPVYSFRTLAGSTDGVPVSASYTFFNYSVGQEGSTKEDTNMSKPSVIAQPDKFWGQSIRVVVLPSKDNGTIAISTLDKTAIQKHISNDIAKVLNNGILTINQLSRPMFEIAPLLSCPSGLGMIGSGATTTDINLAFGLPFSSIPLISNGRPIDLFLDSEVSFDVKVSFPTTFNLYNSLRLGVILEGFYYRPKISEKIA